MQKLGGLHHPYNLAALAAVSNIIILLRLKKNAGSEVSADLSRRTSD
jgi:hypothetical protein